MLNDVGGFLGWIAVLALGALIIWVLVRNASGAAAANKSLLPGAIYDYVGVPSYLPPSPVRRPLSPRIPRLPPPPQPARSRVRPSYLQYDPSMEGGVLRGYNACGGVRHGNVQAPRFAY